MKKLFLLLSITAFGAQATTWNVGPGQTYTVPSAVSNLVQDNDTIKIAAGVYLNDPVIWAKKNLVFIGLGTGANRSVIKWNGGDIPNGKGLWVFANASLTGSITVDNIVFEGARVSDANGGNGAGIRYQAKNLTVRNCLFLSCQNGILEGGSYTGSIVSILNSEFNNNGYELTGSVHSGYEHSIYISAQTDSLLVRNCYFHDPRGEGNLIKTRAQKSYILYNLIDEALGKGSWEINIAQGGLTVIVGNTIIQGTSGINHGIISYDAATNAIQNFYFVNNTVINKYAGNFRYFNISPTSGINTFKVYNNIFAKVAAGNMTNFISGTLGAALDTAANRIMPDHTSVGFVNANNDYHLTASAISFINNAVQPGQASSGFSLSPGFEYVDFNSPLITRLTGGSAMDIGAFEYQPPTSITTGDAKKNTVLIYPNPAKIFVKIQLTERQSFDDLQLVIFDLTGRKIVTTTSDSTMSFGIGHLQCGVYFYALYSKGEKISDGKLLVE